MSVLRYETGSFILQPPYKPNSFGLGSQTQLTGSMRSCSLEMVGTSTRIRE